MATLQELRDERVRKLQDLTVLGVQAYPAISNRTNMSQDVIDNYDELAGKTVTIAGRITSIRKFGKLAFIVLKDASGQVQLFLKDGTVNDSPNYADSELGLKDISLLDNGDFIEATGAVITTKTGEKSVEATDLRILAKSLRPMPSEQEG
ncbi:MAG: lysyl-tRNA synthetase, class, partial [Patescibacteria group bacterium]|nr:lysyl-tRNA synthetase, class [Patescibacteria group bacterium]